MTLTLHCFMYVRLFNLEYECIYFKRQCEGFPGGSVVKNPPASAGDMGLIPDSGRSPGEGKRQPAPVFLPGKPHGQRSLEGYSLWGLKKSDTT